MKIILGDNQFFGVNHANLKKATETQSKFSGVSDISNFVNNALTLGMHGFMINSNDLGYKVVEQFDFHSREIECNYSIPYPHKYADVVNDQGIIGLLFLALKRLKFRDIIAFLKFVISQNVIHLVPIMVRIEIPRTLPKGSTIYLQNVLTDLIMGLKNGDEILSYYIQTIKRMGYKPGLITLNLGRLQSLLSKENQLEDLCVCFNINNSGFNVFPSKHSVEERILKIRQETKWKLMGMSIFSSGSKSTSIEDSIVYIKNLKLDYIVFGSSSLENIKSNLDLFGLKSN